MSQRLSLRIMSSSVFEVRVERIAEAELRVDVAVVDLDVARLVDHLRRRVELAVESRHRVDQLRGREQRALLAVQELRQRPRERSRC